MTVLNVSIHPARVVMSQDRGLYEGKGLPPIDAAAGPFYPSRGRRARPAALSLVTKVRSFPERRLLIGGAGSWSRYAMLPRYLPDGDLDAIAPQMKVCLEHLVSEILGIDELIVIIAGYSESEGRCLGYAYQMGDGFTPVRLDAGHTMVPAANPAAPDYARLCELWTAASAGEEMEAFHHALFRNQVWSYVQGMLRPGVHLSDELDVFTVDALPGRDCGPEAERRRRSSARSGQPTCA